MANGSEWIVPEEVKRAMALLDSPEVPDVETAIRVAGGVRDVERFDLAVAVLERIAPDKSHKRFRKWVEQSAMCLSKDRDVPVVERHERALKLLREKADLETTDSPETLGIAGGICKRWWQADGQRSHLEQSLRYYSRGHERGQDTVGYAGINTAYLLDLLTSLDGVPELPLLQQEREQRFGLAAQIRREVIDKLKGRSDLETQWWYHATLAEAHLGLGDLGAAVARLAEGLVKGPPKRGELTTTVQQLADLARIGPPAMQKLGIDVVADRIAAAVKVEAHAFRSAVTGKVGLALSGGGFRASLFHIGVLAALADAGVLRHVEVLSCVSGGSIFGAHYYLELRKMLQENAAHSDGNYVTLVDKVMRDFVQGVRENIRVRLADSMAANLRMTFVADYSRTDRAGELYEEVLFSRTGVVPPIYLNELKIAPAEWTETGDFTPKYHNWRLRSKVPILVLNASTLNTGHTWQFTATYMGEPPLATSGIDALERLRRFYYDDPTAPDSYKQFRLGRAVAASSCVPGLFEPIVLRDLYPERTIRLVDGGVHDNQGVGTLLDEGCRVVLVSDASGQMRAEHDPAGGLFAVPVRSDDVLQARLREVQLEDLLGRQRSQSIQGLMFVHLTKDLDQKLITWIGGKEKAQPATPAVTSYFVRKDVQQKLAEVRTDLDSFSDTEAFCLMASGYQMTESALTHRNVPTLIAEGQTWQRGKWPFLALSCVLDEKHDDTPAILEMLSAANKRLFRVWSQDEELRRLSPVLKGVGIGAALLAARGLWRSRLRVGPVLLGTLAAAILLRKAASRKGLQETLLGAALTVVGYPLAKLNRRFNERFLHAGRWPR